MSDKKSDKNSNSGSAQSENGSPTKEQSPQKKSYSKKRPKEDSASPTDVTTKDKPTPTKRGSRTENPETCYKRIKYSFGDTVNSFPGSEMSKRAKIPDNRSVSQLVSDNVTIIKNVLSFLNFGDLESCARVCGEWDFVAAELFKLRNNFESFYAGGCLDDLRILPLRFAKFIKEISIKPQLILGIEPHETKFPFCNPCLEKQSRADAKGVGKCKCIKKDYDKLFRVLPPASAGNFRISSYGVISSYLGEFRTVYTKEDNDFHHSCLLFPDTPNFRIDSHYFTKSDLIGMSDHRMEHILLKPDLSAKAVLIYTTSSSQRVFATIRLLLSILRQKQPAVPVSIGGGVIKKIVNMRDPEAQCQLVMFIFRGTKLSAYSTVMKETKPQDICSAFERLRDRIMPLYGQKLCFMTECVDRQSLYLSDDLDAVCNLETRCMNNYLPGVFTYGFWGRGEIGIETASESEAEPNLIEELAHCFATSFLFLILEP